ncbi:MAG TPA: LPS export ABC transporter periplasmic protein LptC [Steroidobacteraceae bacterium]|nr:LPS export ABC transporter periplasmic protein LptC [Steroidobacteraceae bacterium]
MNYRLLIFLGLALVGVAVWLTLTPRRAEPLVAKSSGPAAADQGYSARDASVVETGADGLPLYTLQAHDVQQNPDTDTINLTTVHMSYRGSADSQWQGRADSAVVQQDSSQIDLAGAIDLTGTFTGSAQPLHILTDKLRVDTQTQVIRNRSPVTLTWAGVIVEARGLVVNVKESSVKLEAGVHGQVAQ